jgi:hypothetical protein
VEKAHARSLTFIAQHPGGSETVFEYAGALLETVELILPNVFDLYVLL